jgi:hypothetical protein
MTREGGKFPVMGSLKADSGYRPQDFYQADSEPIVFGHVQVNSTRVAKTSRETII